MTLSQSLRRTPEGAILISYKDLVASPETLQDSIHAALGSTPDALGVICVDNLPEDFPAKRERLFRLIERFAQLPEEQREKLSRPESKYSFGWSWGKEVMNGRPDIYKGSYYANPMVDRPDVSDVARKQYPEYYDGNVWPEGFAGLEDFEVAFKELGSLIHGVGLSLAKACEPFVASAVKTSATVESLLRESQCSKARLLHYFPPEASKDSEPLAEDALCGTHVDHSLLTGLCAAMYLFRADGSPANEPAKAVPPPSKTAGLYIYPRSSKTPVKVLIPANCLAFQTGEALQLLTNGALAATPHFVNSGGPEAADVELDGKKGKVSRETFAFFLQPDVEDVVGPDGETFGAFTKRVLERHYQDA